MCPYCMLRVLVEVDGRVKIEPVMEDAQLREMINWLAGTVRVLRKELRDLKRPAGSGKYRATTESELAESSGQFSVEVGEARPPGVATEAELAESSGEPLTLVKLGLQRKQRTP